MAAETMGGQNMFDGLCFRVTLMLKEEGWHKQKGMGDEINQRHPRGGKRKKQTPKKR
jgi:hypothetical protein